MAPESRPAPTLGVLLVLSISAGADAVGCVRNLTHPHRLPSTVVPSLYQLSLELPDPARAEESGLSYHGAVNITVTISSPTTCVVLHANELVFGPDDVALLPAGGSAASPSAIEFEAEDQFVVITFANELAVGAATLSIARFDAKFGNRTGSGFFLSDNAYDP
eukprot:gene5875-1050_t